jgi:NodT family efflux transporter outer membrane factor (OMF) lipoprotein
VLSAKQARVCLAVATAVALVGCASGARKPDLTLPAAYEAPAGAAALAPAALDTWWTIFDDPALNALEDGALRDAPDAKTQIARLMEAAATRNSNVLQTYPTGGISGSANYKDTVQIGGPTNSLIPVGGISQNDSISFNPTWELDFLGGLFDARRAARDDYAATRFDAEAARATLAADVADGYFQARGAAIQLDDANESVRIDRELLRVAQVKADRGLGPTSDADRVAGDLAQAVSQADSLTAELHVDQRLLLILVGRGPEPVESLPMSADVPDPPPVPQAVPGDLLQRRPDVREADWKMRAAAIRTKLAKEQIFPNLVLEPAIGLARQVAPGIEYIPPLTFVPQQQTTNTGFWSYGVGLSAPVLDIPRLLQDAKAQGARTEEAVIAYEKAVQSAYGDAENALVRLSADEQRIKVLEDGEARAHRAYDAAKQGYDLGFNDLTTALQAEQTWRGDRSALTAERVQALRRAVQTYKALGGGWAYAATKPATQTQ